jgi:hypothetical protein
VLAAFTTSPPGNRVKFTIIEYRCSTLRGSCPISQLRKSFTTSTIAASGPHEYASPMPDMPWSVSIFTMQ